MRRYVIIGSGAAGIAAIEAIRSQDTQGEIIVIAEDRHGYYSRPGLAYLLSKEIPESQLFPFSKEDFNRLQVKWVNAQAVQIHSASHRVALNEGSTILYDRLLIATGSRAVRMSIPGIDFEGSVKLDDLDDAQRIIKLARRGKTAVVVGGGITALELVEGLSARGVKVHYFLREDRYWAAVLDERESRIVEDRLREEGVKIHYHTEMVEVLGKQGRVVGIRTKQNETIRCDIVAVAIGVRARIELATACGLKTDRGILVDEYMQTSISDIFAAGDVGQVLDPRTGKTVLDTLWSPARNQGQYAGLNMSGKTITFCKQVPFNVTRLAGLTTTIIGSVGGGSRDPDLVGIARGDSESWRDASGVCDRSLIAAQSEFDVNHLRLMMGENRLMGAFLMGDQTLSNPVQQLVVQQADITPIRERLLRPDQPLPEIIINFYNQWQVQYAV
jgi:NAD(P)H-nitrite reductase large subunit